MLVTGAAFKQCLRVTATRGIQARCYSSAPSSSIVKLLATPADGQEREVFGFIRSIRKQKTRAFASIGDGTSLEPLQAMLTPDQAQSLTTGAAVRLTGQWEASPNKNAQACELHVNNVALLGESDPATFPLQKKYQTADYLRTMPHMRPRLPFNSLLLRLRSQSIANLTQFFASREFVQTHPPIMTSSDCEGAGEVFSVATEPFVDDKATKSEESSSFFRGPKYLTVSSQLHLEALAQSVGKVWTLSPTFRAERSDTSRHLSEFYMLEAEQCFVDKMSAIMDLTEDMLRHMVTDTYNTKVGDEIINGNRTGTNTAESRAEAAELSKQLEARWQGMMNGPWPRITYTEAIEILKESGQKFEHTPEWGAGLQAEHERYLAGNLGKGGPIFVTNYPKSIKPFYMLPSEDTSTSGETVDCFDLLVPEFCEVAGGSMREHRLPQLLSAMHQHGLIRSNFGQDVKIEELTEEALGGLKWYVDLRTWGTVPHGGFGVGFDRILGYLAGVPNIREVVAFPRWVGRCDC